jgi:hypothetical protein
MFGIWFLDFGPWIFEGVPLPFHAITHGPAPDQRVRVVLSLLANQPTGHFGLKHAAQSLTRHAFAKTYMLIKNPSSAFEIDSATVVDQQTHKTN